MHLILIFCLSLSIIIDNGNIINLELYLSEIIDYLSMFKFNFYISSDIPYFGSGLGSSGSFNVVLTNSILVNNL